MHSWDIEEALDPGATLSDDLARWGLDELTDADSLTAAHFDLVDVPVLRSPNDASTTYLAVFGR